MLAHRPSRARTTCPCRSPLLHRHSTIADPVCGSPRRAHRRSSRPPRGGSSSMNGRSFDGARRTSTPRPDAEPKTARRSIPRPSDPIVVRRRRSGACGKDADTQMCLDDCEKMKGSMAEGDDEARQVAAGAYQACRISCDVTKDEDLRRLRRRHRDPVREGTPRGVPTPLRGQQRAEERDRLRSGERVAGGVRPASSAAEPARCDHETTRTVPDASRPVRFADLARPPTRPARRARGITA